MQLDKPSVRTKRRYVSRARDGDPDINSTVYPAAASDHAHAPGRGETSTKGHSDARAPRLVPGMGDPFRTQTPRDPFGKIQEPTQDPFALGRAPEQHRPERPDPFLIREEAGSSAQYFSQGTAMFNSGLPEVGNQFASERHSFDANPSHESVSTYLHPAEQPGSRVNPTEDVRVDLPATNQHNRAPRASDYTETLFPTSPEEVVRSKQLLLKFVPVKLFSRQALQQHFERIASVHVTHVSLRGSRRQESRRTAVVSFESDQQASLALANGRSFGGSELNLSVFRPSVPPGAKNNDTTELLFSSVPQELFAEDRIKGLFNSISGGGVLRVNLRERPYHGSMKRTSIISFTSSEAAALALRNMPMYNGHPLNVSLRRSPPRPASMELTSGVPGNEAEKPPNTANLTAEAAATGVSLLLPNVGGHGADSENIDWDEYQFRAGQREQLTSDDILKGPTQVERSSSGADAQAERRKEIASLKAAIQRKEQERSKFLEKSKQERKRATPKRRPASSENREDQISKGAAWRKIGEKVEFRNATAFVGTCRSMCPYQEFTERVEQRDISAFETASGGEPDFQRAVKKYRRSAAISELPYPEEVRPPAVLMQTMEHLKGICNKSNSSFVDIHNFVRDRTRSIRQDFTLQGIRDVACIRVHEESVRFHIMSEHRLFGTDPSNFSSKQNLEQLDKCLISLREMYDLRREGGETASSNEPEMQAYYMLTQMSDPKTCVQLCTGFAHDVRNSLPVQFALRVVMAASQSFGNFARYFSCVKAAPYLTACLMHSRFTSVRAKALAVINTTYGNPSSRDHIGISTLSETLGFENDEETISFCSVLGMDVKNESLSATSCAAAFVVTPSTTFQESNVSKWTPSKSLKLIEVKAEGFQPAAIISGTGSTDYGNVALLPKRLRAGDGSAYSSPDDLLDPSQPKAPAKSGVVYASREDSGTRETAEMRSVRHFSPRKLKPSSIISPAPPLERDPAQHPTGYVVNDKPSTLREKAGQDGGESLTGMASKAHAERDESLFSSGLEESQNEALRTGADTLSSLQSRSSHPQRKRAARVIFGLREIAPRDEAREDCLTSRAPMLADKIAGTSEEVVEEVSASKGKPASDGDLDPLNENLARFIERTIKICQRGLEDAGRVIESLVLRSRSSMDFERESSRARLLLRSCSERIRECRTVLVHCETGNMLSEDARRSCEEELEMCRCLGAVLWERIHSADMMSFAGGLASGQGQDTMPKVKVQDPVTNLFSRRELLESVHLPKAESYPGKVAPYVMPKFGAEREAISASMKQAGCVRWQAAVIHLGENTQGSVQSSITRLWLRRRLTAPENQAVGVLALHDPGDRGNHFFSVVELAEHSLVPPTADIVICTLQSPTAAELGLSLVSLRRVLSSAQERREALKIPAPGLVALYPDCSLSPNRWKEDYSMLDAAFRQGLNGLVSSGLISYVHVIELPAKALKVSDESRAFTMALTESVHRSVQLLSLPIGLQSVCIGDYVICLANAALVGELTESMEHIESGQGFRSCSNFWNAVNQAWADFTDCLELEQSRWAREISSQRELFASVRHAVEDKLMLPSLEHKNFSGCLKQLSKFGKLPPIFGTDVLCSPLLFCQVLVYMLPSIVHGILGSLFESKLFLPRRPSLEDSWDSRILSLWAGGFPLSLHAVVPSQYDMDGVSTTRRRHRLKRRKPEQSEQFTRIAPTDSLSVRQETLRRRSLQVPKEAQLTKQRRTSLPSNYGRRRMYELYDNICREEESFGQTVLATVKVLSEKRRKLDTASGCYRITEFSPVVPKPTLR